jgi:16S rRNA (guanine966-N2)-methyltransferase
MRVIAGVYRGRVLRSPSNFKTRPTSDRLRETLFNIISPKIDEETRFLDLCAGTGAIGIEALSRGAGFASFVDKSRRSCALIEQNLDALEIPETETDVVCSSAETFVSREHEKSWDIIYYDPPYDSDYAEVLLEIGTSENTILKTGGMLIAEHHSKKNMPDVVENLRRWRILKQGESYLSFYEKE